MERKIIARARSQRWFERFPRGIPVAVFVLTLAVTVLAVFAIQRAETGRAHALTKEAAGAIAAGLERRINGSSAYLRAGAIILSTKPDVGMADFHEFATQYGVREPGGGSDVISWAPRFAPGGIAAFERMRRKEGDADFTVHPLPPAGQAFVAPVSYLEPVDARNRGVLGFEIYSEPVRRAAIELAIVSGRPTASGKITLLQDGKPELRSGFGLFMPVYAGGDRERVKGLLSSRFNAHRLLETVLKEQGLHDLNVAFYDGFPGPDGLLAGVGAEQVLKRAHTMTFSAAGHQFTIAVEPTNAATLSTMSILTLLFGLLVAALLTLLASIVSRKAAEDGAALLWFQEQASIRNSLTRELNHRVKNTLANVLSIIALTRRRETDVNGFADSLNGRIRALSATHDLLTQSEWGTTPIRAVASAELAPYTQQVDHLIELQGPDVELAPNDALSLGLAIHELATNAAKYGALSVISGSLSIHWTMISSELARIEWRERGGPPVAEQRRRGFGTELIEKIVAHELGRPVELRFEPEGVVCVLITPVRKPVTAFRMRAPREA
ncbi:MAG: CHASE domain-containing protein [Novosphingobium sp.]